MTLVLNRADTSVGISQGDVDRLLGRAPDVLVPSDRAIPRAMTDGEPIVEADVQVPCGAGLHPDGRVRASRPSTPPRRRRRRPRRRLSLTGRTYVHGAPRATHLPGKRQQRRPEAGDRPVRGGEEPHPPRTRQRARATALRGRGRLGPGRVETEIRAPAAARSRRSRARTATACRRRSPTTSSATGRWSSCCPTRRSPRSWSTGRTRSGSSGTGSSR